VLLVETNYGDMRKSGKVRYCDAIRLGLQKIMGTVQLSAIKFRAYAEITSGSIKEATTR
jgi:hypothetical protein